MCDSTMLMPLAKAPGSVGLLKCQYSGVCESQVGQDCPPTVDMIDDTIVVVFLETVRFLRFCLLLLRLSPIPYPL